MTSDVITLKAQKRTEAGHKTGTALREQGLLPAVTYGKDKQTEQLVLKTLDFEKVYAQAGENTVISLDIDGTTQNVVIYDAQMDPVSGKPLHADFFQIRMDEKITAEVPLIFEGVSVAVKDDGGTLVKNYDALEVTALPTEMPHEIKVDIAVLKTFDDVLTIADLKLPANWEIEEETEAVIAVVTPPRSEAELAALDEEITEDVAEVADVEEKKPTEEAEEGESEASQEKTAEADPEKPAKE